MKKVYLSALALFVAMVFWVSFALAAPVLHMDVEGYPTGTEEITVKKGDHFTFHIWLSDVPEPGLIAWNHDLVLDPKVEVVDVHIMDPFIGEGKIVGEELEMGGMILTGEPVFGTTVSLANITFHCIELGETDLIQAWHFPIAENFVLANFTSIDQDLGFPGTEGFSPPSIHVNQVPIPTTLLLLGSGLIGVIGLRRKIQG